MKAAIQLESLHSTHQDIVQMIDYRTDNLIGCIMNQIAVANTPRLIVVGGAGHLLDAKLIKQLKVQNIKFCAISAALGPTGVENQSSTLTKKFKVSNEFYRRV